MNLVTIITGTLLLIVNTQLRALEWRTDFEKAQREADTQAKHLLLNFSGSDWCSWCIKLEKEIFSQPWFKQKITNHFIPVMLDFPRKKPLAPTLKKQNDRLAQKYQVKGFPTIVLLNSAGESYAQTGYRQGGVRAYYDHLLSLKKGYQQLETLTAAAEGADGLEKARLLDKIAAYYIEQEDMKRAQNIIIQIKTLDKENKAGLKQKYENIAALQQIISEFSRSGQAQQTIEELLKLAEKTLFKGTLQQIYLITANIYYRELKDNEKFYFWLEKAYNAASESDLALEIKKYLDQKKIR